jgi:hypothetical protein
MYDAVFQCIVLRKIRLFFFIVVITVCVCACPPVIVGDTVKHALTSTSSPPQ